MILYHSSDKLFTQFNNRYIKDIGFHFGTEAQARDRTAGIPGEANKAYLYKCRINANKFYGNGITDLGQWDSFDMIEEYFNPLHQNYELFDEEEWKLIKTANDFKAELQKRGYAGIEYLNMFEYSDNQDENSFIVFDADNINIIETIIM